MDNSITPRSDYGTPRDDRFLSPRLQMVRNNSSTNSDEWLTPRSSPSQSDGEFNTPRLTENDLSSITKTSYNKEKENYNNEDVEISVSDVEDIFSYARHGRSDDIERLLQCGVPVDVRDSIGNTILIIACQNGNKKVAKAVLRRGANINSRNLKGNTPLHYCFHFGYGETLGKYLISKNADCTVRNSAGKLCWEGL